MKKVLCLLLALLLVSGSLSALAGQSAESALTQTTAWVKKAVPAPQVGSVGGEWAVLALARGGSFSAADAAAYLQGVEAYVKERKGVLHTKKYTEYSRVVLALTAIGKNPADVAGYNLLTPLGDFEKTVWQGVNGGIWALIALDSGAYAMPVNGQAAVQADRQMYVDYILSQQLQDGGFSISGNTADPDMTAMALQALAAYQKQEPVQLAIQRALACLSAIQKSDGSFSSWDESNCESCAQVIIALCRLGLSPEDSRFVKNGRTVTQALISYAAGDGGFSHVAGGASDQMASEQALCALTALQRRADGKTDLYDMSDVKAGASTDTGAGLPGKDPSVIVPSVTAAGKTFSDLQGHADRQAVERLAERGIIDGMGNGSFQPNGKMTRAQFCAIVVRALGLKPQAGTQFSDVPTAQWYAGYIGTAAARGIVNGVGNGKFAPEGTITRQEAACMAARAAALCGMSTQRSAAQIRDMLAQFGDYRLAADWAAGALTFCYDSGVLNQSDLNIRPGDAILRCEVAQMVYQMLVAARLLEA